MKFAFGIPSCESANWLLAVAVIWDWLSEDPLWLHTWLGYMAAVLVILRVLWGFVGPSYARFVSFITGPRTIYDYLAGLVASHLSATSATAQPVG